MYTLHGHNLPWWAVRADRSCGADGRCVTGALYNQTIKGAGRYLPTPLCVNQTFLGGMSDLYA